MCRRFKAKNNCTASEIVSSVSFSANANTVLILGLRLRIRVFWSDLYPIFMIMSDPNPVFKIGLNPDQV